MYGLEGRGCKKGDTISALCVSCFGSLALLTMECVGLLRVALNHLQRLIVSKEAIVFPPMAWVERGYELSF